MEHQSPAVNLTESNVVRLEQQFFGGPEAKSQVIEFEKLFKLLQHYKYLLVLFLIIGALAGYFVSTNKIPYYQTNVDIVVEPESSNRAEFFKRPTTILCP